MTSEKKTVAVLYGGRSTEYEISLLTAYSVINAMDLEKYRVLPVYIQQDGRWIAGSEIKKKLEYKDQLLLKEDQTLETNAEHWLAPSASAAAINKRPDVVFPLLHGPNGEDGTVQGLFELLNIAYVGSGVSGSSVGMDKVLMKDVFSAHGIQGPKYLSVPRFDWESDAPSVILEVKNSIGYPCFVKPANCGSSVGISQCLSETDLSAAVEEAFRFDTKVIIEEKIDGREVEIGVIGNHSLSVSVPGEIKTGEADFYDYQSKYQEGKSTLIIPADLPGKVRAELEDVAKRAFVALNLSGLARVDVFIREGDHRVILNEVNTMPGFTQFSMFPLLWQHTGISYRDLIEKLIDLGIEKFREKQKIHYRIDE
ncbi:MULTISPECIES: D-alanine--D-alanine ligase [unclassified Sporolactobacillus]|uniref:D-alanine--D-alanine ligase n=1 Tax=unclassified Sporolactobacillus TaxID=2628533 RepID=UPI002367B393|nr:D-alanine--D-alanine ligase [Sporolactobacillus sp. CQH2019]MDD9147326.1 D-alanine--D-alanine ligase [Sporolactobacillus sp. CQH2019]